MTPSSVSQGAEPGLSRRVRGDGKVEVPVEASRRSARPGWQDHGERAALARTQNVQAQVVAPGLGPEPDLDRLLVGVLCPSTAITTSPGNSPACCAADPGRTLVTVGPDTPGLSTSVAPSDGYTGTSLKAGIPHRKSATEARVAAGRPGRQVRPAPPPQPPVPAPTALPAVRCPGRTPRGRIPPAPPSRPGGPSPPPGP